MNRSNRSQHAADRAASRHARAFIRADMDRITASSTRAEANSLRSITARHDRHRAHARTRRCWLLALAVWLGGGK